ncbi:hypothetical protein Agub_g9525 [Astrephomene gubernaculifera]|uniref:Protein kinase domain-containing protein n=1 Tax=Astrephomene gubernaculifera TaxID=47775 RepID=A0AAD3DTF0_9CHLO|nr:hypothetical protein Agub_g9525 [Astrephomene gubernaculifera]
MRRRGCNACFFSCFGLHTCLWREVERQSLQNGPNTLGGPGQGANALLEPVLPSDAPADAFGSTGAPSLLGGGRAASSAAPGDVSCFHTTGSEALATPTRPQHALESDGRTRRDDTAPELALLAATGLRHEQQQVTTSPQSAAWRGGEELDPKIRIPFKEITLHKVIGKGSFKTVYRGSWNNTHVAVVAMRRGGLVAEARLLQRLSTHPNLVQLYRWSADSAGNEYLVMELLQLGSLDAVLRSIGRQLLTQTKMTIVEQVVSACLELSHEGLVHGDLAARNLLVKSLEPPHVKLADFGLARPVLPAEAEAAVAALAPSGGAAPPPPPDGAPVASTSAAGVVATGGAQQQSSAGPFVSVVPARWAAPEVLAGAPPSEAGDVWSFGVTCWEIFANGAEPYASLSNRQILPALRSGYRLDRPRGCPLELWELVQQCWSTEPRVRPRFSDIAATLRSWREAYVSSKAAAAAPATGPTSPPTATSGTAAPAVVQQPQLAARDTYLRINDSGDTTAVLLQQQAAAAAAAAAAAGGRSWRTAGPTSTQVSASVAINANAHHARGHTGAVGYSPVGLSPLPNQRMNIGPSGSSPPGNHVPGPTLSTHMSFDIAEPAITPAYTSGSSVAMQSGTAPCEQPSLMDGSHGVSGTAADGPGGAAAAGIASEAGGFAAPAFAGGSSHARQGATFGLQGTAFTSAAAAAAAAAAGGEGGGGAAMHGMMNTWSRSSTHQNISSSNMRTSPCGRSSAGARSSAGTQASGMGGFLEVRMDAGHRLGRMSSGATQEGSSMNGVMASAFAAAIAPFGPSFALRQAPGQPAPSSLSSGRTPSTILGASIFYESMQGNSIPSTAQPSHSNQSMGGISGSQGDGSGSRRHVGGASASERGDFSSGLLPLASVPEDGTATPVTRSNTTAATNTRSSAWVESLPAGGAAGGAHRNRSGAAAHQGTTSPQQVPVDGGRSLDAAAAAAGAAAPAAAEAATAVGGGANRRLASPYVRIGELMGHPGPPPPLSLPPGAARAYTALPYWNPQGAYGSSTPSLGASTSSQQAPPPSPLHADMRGTLSPFATASAVPMPYMGDDLSLRSMLKVSGPNSRSIAEPPSSSFALAGIHARSSSATCSADGAGPSAAPALAAALPTGMMLLPSIVSSDACEGCKDGSSSGLGREPGTAEGSQDKLGAKETTMQGLVDDARRALGVMGLSLAAGDVGEEAGGGAEVGAGERGELQEADATAAGRSAGASATSVASVEQQQQQQLMAVMSFDSLAAALSGANACASGQGSTSTTTAAAANNSPTAMGAAAAAGTAVAASAGHRRADSTAAGASEQRLPVSASPSSLLLQQQHQYSLQQQQLQQQQQRASLSLTLAIRAPRARRGSNGSQASSTQRCGGPHEHTSWHGSSRNSGASSRNGVGSGLPSRLLGTALLLDSSSTPSGGLDVGARHDANHSPATSVRSVRTAHSLQSGRSARSVGGAGGPYGPSGSRRRQAASDYAGGMRHGPGSSAMASQQDERSGSLGTSEGLCINMGETAAACAAGNGPAGRLAGACRNVARGVTSSMTPQAQPLTRGSRPFPDGMQGLYDEEELHRRAAFGQGGAPMTVLQVNELGPGLAGLHVQAGGPGMDSTDMLQVRHMVLQELPESGIEGLDSASLLVMSRGAGAAAAGAPGGRRALLVTRGFEDYETEPAGMYMPGVAALFGTHTVGAGRGPGGGAAAGAEAGAARYLPQEGQRQQQQQQQPQQQQRQQQGSHQQSTPGDLLLDTGSRGTMPGVQTEEFVATPAVGTSPEGTAAAGRLQDLHLGRTTSGRASSSLFMSTHSDVLAERQAIFDYLQTRHLQELQQERDW